MKHFPPKRCGGLCGVTKTVVRAVQVATDGLWEDEKEAKEGQGVGFWVGDFRPTNQQARLLAPRART